MGDALVLFAMSERLCAMHGAGSKPCIPWTRANLVLRRASGWPGGTHGRHLTSDFCSLLLARCCSCWKQVGSTGVGSLTMAFLILLVSTIVFIQRSQTAPNKQISYLCIYICGFAAMS